MRRTLVRLAATPLSSSSSSLPIIQISNGTFYKQHPTTSSASSDHNVNAEANPALFPGLNFTLPSHSAPVQKWTVLSKSSAARTLFLQILRGQHVCLPPAARSFPYLSTDAIAEKDARLRSASNAIQYVGFDAERGQSGGSGMRGAYMSARYESLREETDFSLLDFLMGNTELNADERLARHPDQAFVKKIMEDLRLQELAEMPVTHLSNGQTRRAKIAKALLSRPEVLLLDGPFMGLDPPTRKHLSALLGDMAEQQAPRLILSLKPDEHVPEWITHMAFVTQKCEVGMLGLKLDVVRHIHKTWEDIRKLGGIHAMKHKSKSDEAWEIMEVSNHLWEHTIPETRFEDRREARALRMERKLILKQDFRRPVLARDGSSIEGPLPTPGEALVEMQGMKVQYGDKAVLGNWQQQLEDGSQKDGLWWTVRQGQRWGVFGPNGSGKTTLISLITSDHPQTYSLPIKLFGRSRLPEVGQPGISIFDLQKRIGHSSPEVHVFFPKHLTVRRTIESAWADTPLTRPKLTYADDEKVTAALTWFRGELAPALGPPQWMKDEMARVVHVTDEGLHGEATDVAREEVARDEAVREERRIRQAQEIWKQEDIDAEGLDWADQMTFGELTFAAQRVALFIRAVIRNPDLVVLDEAFSGMDDFARDKCHLFLTQGQAAIFHPRQSYAFSTASRITRSNLSRVGLVKVQGLQDHQALIVISHKKEEVPGCVRDWICLPESGLGEPRFGQLEAPLELSSSGWKQIWNEHVAIVEARTLRAREQKAIKRAAIVADPEWPSEPPVRRNKEPKDHALGGYTLRFKSRALEETLPPKKQPEKYRDLAPEQRDLLRVKARVWYRARMASMTPEETAAYHKAHSDKFWAGREEELKEVNRDAKRRFMAKIQEPGNESLLRQFLNTRREWLKKRKEEMNEEMIAEAKRRRKEKLLERMKDPLWEMQYRMKSRENQRLYRLRKKAEAGG